MQEAGYATDPQYAKKLISIMRQLFHRTNAGLPHRHDGRDDCFISAGR